MSEVNQGKGIRIALDSEASAAFRSIKAKLKSTAPFVKFSPSDLVSFIVSDYFAFRFEAEIEALMAEFFSSDAFFLHARQEAKGSANFDDLMAEALTKARRIKKNRRKRNMPVDEPPSGASV